MEDGEAAYEKLEETEERAQLLRDRFRLSVISIAEAEAKKQGLEIAESVVACISDLAFKFTELLANDLGLFAQHAGRKSINVEDVILSAHRNEHLLGLLRSFSHDLKGKELKTAKMRKRPLKEDTTADFSQKNIRGVLTAIRDCPTSKQFLAESAISVVVRRKKKRRRRRRIVAELKKKRSKRRIVAELKEEMATMSIN